MLIDVISAQIFIFLGYKCNVESLRHIKTLVCSTKFFPYNGTLFRDWSLLLNDLTYCIDIFWRSLNVKNKKIYLNFVTQPLLRWALKKDFFFNWWYSLTCLTFIKHLTRRLNPKFDHQIKWIWWFSRILQDVNTFLIYKFVIYPFRTFWNIFWS